MLGCRIKFFSQKVGKPRQVPLWMTGSSDYIRGNDGTSVSDEQVPQAGCEVQLPQFEASWCLLALIEPNWPRKGQPSRVATVTLQGSDLKSDVPQWSALMVKCNSRVRPPMQHRTGDSRSPSAHLKVIHATQTN